MKHERLETMGYIWGLTGLACLASALTVAAQPAELPIGTALPAQDHVVSLVGGTETTVGALTGVRGTVIIFWSNMCPWSEGYTERVTALSEEAARSDILLTLVNSNDPEAFPQETAAAGVAAGHPMPYVVDSGGVLARALGAFRTPHVFAFDADRILVYAGAVDDAPADAGNVQEAYLETVIRLLADAEAPAVPRTRAFGCRIRFPGG